ncbi:hypothetical protein ACDX78_02330 [Virgibacillus oceani]
MEYVVKYWVGNRSIVDHLFTPKNISQITIGTQNMIKDFEFISVQTESRITCIRSESITSYEILTKEEYKKQKDISRLSALISDGFRR